MSTPVRSRSRSLSLSGSRAVTVAETAIPSGDAGIECQDWDQILLALSASGVAECDIQIYRRYADFAVGGAGTDAWLPGEIIPGITTLSHGYPLKGPAVLVIDTLGCDRIQALAVTLTSPATTLYMKWYGLTLAGGSAGGPRGQQSQEVLSSNFRPLKVSVGHSDFDFVDGGSGNDTLVFTDVADRSGVLVIGAKYHVWADQDCYVATGGNTITAVSGDYRLPKNQPREYIPQTGRTYISAVRIATSGNLYISKANSYTPET